MKRRDILTAAAAAPISALSASSLSAATTGMSHAELLEHHKSEFFRLWSELVPEGTTLKYIMMNIEPARPYRELVYLVAQRPEWTDRDAPYYNFNADDGEWVLHCPGDKQNSRSS